MTIPPYVRLANEIAAQFRHRQTGEAAVAIAEHLRSFWDPRMRTQLVAHAEAGGAGLDPLLVHVVALLR
ncbi:MAG: formate dehydrogenase [Dactylosporangium sp.]|jgi:formate dehydrogenase subunit delta|nr:formate dehydrogenase [Dactylosporangium sp.]